MMSADIDRLTAENRTHVATIGCLIEQARSAEAAYQAEIDRLCRCNEQLSRSHAQVRNILETEITGLLAIIDHCRRYAPSVVAAAEGALTQQDAITESQSSEEQLRQFRDAVYEHIIENAGTLENPYAFIRQSRWEQIKAAEKQL